MDMKKQRTHEGEDEDGKPGKTKRFPVESISYSLLEALICFAFLSPL
jgi:hypothetical protein